MSQDPGSSENQGGQQQPGGGWQGQPTEYNAGWQAQQPPPGYGPPAGAPAGPPPGYGAPPPGYGGPGGVGGGPSGQMPPGKNFLGALFDVEFNYFATPVVVKVLYIIGIVVIALGWLAAIVSGFLNSAVAGIVAIVVGAVVALFYLILFRVTLEFFYAVVRMSEDIHHRR
ncbi:DUF4282 domain-containing protein [Pseudonocardia benzenivorans]|uniref:DUF4282 domain-containing protein n=1 Tax=Pseudonocardia benzenivorans TaxID=228005 RepID=A0ABW3VP33_9PSEU